MEFNRERVEKGYVYPAPFLIGGCGYFLPALTTIHRQGWKCGIYMPPRSYHQAQPKSFRMVGLGRVSVFFTCPEPYLAGGTRDTWMGCSFLRLSPFHDIPYRYIMVSVS